MALKETFLGSTSLTTTRVSRQSEDKRRVALAEVVAGGRSNVKDVVDDDNWTTPEPIIVSSNPKQDK